MTKAHPKAHIFKRLAEIAQESQTPWERFEWRYKDAPQWVSCSSIATLFDDNAECRERACNQREINGLKLEGPLLEAPDLGSHFWLLFDDYPEHQHIWEDLDIEKTWLAQGRCFRTYVARDVMQAVLVNSLRGQKP